MPKTKKPVEKIKKPVEKTTVEKTSVEKTDKSEQKTISEEPAVTPSTSVNQTDGLSPAGGSSPLIKKCVLICGPESSGTRMTKKMFLLRGWDGNEGHSEKWNEKNLPEEGLIVWRKSMPHANNWWSVEKTIKLLKDKGFDVTVIVTARDWKCMTMSQQKNHHGSLDNVRRAYAEIFKGLLKEDVRWFMFSYESLVTHGMAALDWMMEGIDDPSQRMCMDNANIKYY